MTSELETALDDLPGEAHERLENFGFDRTWFLKMSERLRTGGATDNRVSGRVTAPEEGDIIDVPEPGSEERARAEAAGMELLRAGQCALVVLAGGMATRMGGIVKALAEALPGKTFLDLRLAEQRAIERRSGKTLPLWLMTSYATDGAIRTALGERLDGYRTATFAQRLSLRLSPDGSLFRDQEGQPSEHAPGHGDLPEALQRSGLLERFVAEGGRYVMVANLDNLGATMDPVLIGMHASHGQPVTCEVVDKVGSDRGGIPVRLDGRPVVLEEFRLPAGFDPASVRVFNTNTFHFDARALLGLTIDWTYFVVKKEVDRRPAIQFERLIGEVTSALPTRYVKVPRSGASSRFLPAKDFEELAERRADLEAVAQSRGMLD